MRNLLKKFKAQTKSHKILIATFIVLFAGVGIWALLGTRAATPTASLDVANGAISGCASATGFNGSSSGKVVELGSCQQAGAKLPINYNLASLTGTVRYVAPNGNDSNAGTQSAPFKTLAKAISASSAGNTIVVRGGVYREGNASIGKALRIIAYPGEVPVFNGAQTASNWVTEGSLKYTAYTPQPVTDGSGISFTGGQNLTGDGVGKYPDQAWVGDTQLQQVTSKSAVTGDQFFVDTANNRLYITATNANKGGVEVSQRNSFLKITAANVTIEGIRVSRFSNGGNDYGVFRYEHTGDNSLLQNVEIIDPAFIAVSFGGGADAFSEKNTLKNVTIEGSNWMGVSANYTNDLTVDSVRISRLNQFKEFTNSPQSGAVKTGKSWRIKVVNSQITNNRSHGLWFDQSNYDVDVANNTITNNEGAGVFFEISDDLLLINNYISSEGGFQPVKLAGSSGLKLVNNTIVGGADPVGIYTDSRSAPGCADRNRGTACPGGISSDWDKSNTRTRPATMDWMPRIDLMINNIIGYPATGTSLCAKKATAVCITNTHQSNTAAVNPMEKIIHKADPTRGIPQTVMNGNVYLNGSSYIIYTTNSNFTTVSAFTTAMKAAPVGIDGIEANGRQGNNWANADGSPTSTLAAVHNQAIAVPTDTNINLYIPAGTKHYGVTNK